MSSEQSVLGKDIDPVDTLAELRVKLLNRIYYAIVPLGSIMAVCGAAENWLNFGTWGPMTAYMIAYVIIFAAGLLRNVDYTLRAGAFVLVIYGVAVAELSFFGLTSITSLFMFGFVVFTGLLLGLRIGLAALVLAAATFGGVGSFAVFRQWPNDAHQLGLLMKWLTPWLSFLMMSLSALVSSSLLLGALDRNIKNARKLVKSLSDEIDGRQRAEEELGRNEERFRLLVENVSDVIMLADSRGIIQYVSPALERILGYHSLKALGKNLFRRVHRDDVDKVLQTGRLILAGDAGRHNSVECRLRHNDGSWRSIECIGRLYDDPSIGACIVINVRDITERRQAEEINQRLQEQLQQAQKLEATGRLAGGIAHDFNNLLQVVLGHLDLILSEPQGNPAKAELYEVHRAAERAAELTRQLLAFSRRQIVQPINVNLNELIHQVFKMIGSVLGERIDVRFVEAEDLHTVYIDRGQFEQVLINLCMNAAQAMPNGGTLSIETKNIKLDKAHLKDHPLDVEGQFVLMSVTDTGCGMEPETLAQVFEPFFTTKKPGQGTGLGLATVYGIVRQHNGTIHVESEPGKGSSFKIYIPAVARPAQQTSSKSVTEFVGGSETILVAEDEPMVLKLIGQILRRAGYNVLTAKDGVEAMEVFHDHAEKIDLVVLDVMMPRMGGREVMEQIQSTHPDLPLLFSSGYSETAIHTNFVIKEGLKLIKKPYSRTDLLQHVRDILDKGSDYT